jgi:isopentenyl-diphosphate delta-isomerase type 1
VDPAAEHVVLLDEQRRPMGTQLKTTVHHLHTPLHLAFSLHLFDPTGQALLSQRAVTKQTWPGVWSNACCGHPAPGEDLEAAVRRRLRQELGADVDHLRQVLPDFAYVATDASGVVENEYCPVFVGLLLGDLYPDPAEVGGLRWMAWPELLAQAALPEPDLSPWAVLQLAELARTRFAPGDLRD